MRLLQSVRLVIASWIALSVVAVQAQNDTAAASVTANSTTAPAPPPSAPATPSRARAPIPDNLDPASAAAEAEAKAGPVTWPEKAVPVPPVYTTPVSSTKHLEWAPTPTMGWNSWDCYGAGIWQQDVIANAEYMVKNLKAHGWNLITIDIQWYEPLAHTTNYREGAWLITDEYGRLHPAPNRFPLTAQTGSFKPIADYLHSRGLLFGLHLMRGIPRQSVDRDNTPILGTPYHAADIADKAHVCGWNHDMYGVDMSKPGAQEYYNSVFKQMAAWGLDFVKVDDLSGHNAEIEAIRKAIDQSGRPIIFSISPGGPSNDVVATNANQWRISGDFWDNWRALYGQFNLLDLGTPYRGPGHWPDADMIPFGNLNVWAENTGNSRTKTWTSFTHDEEVTLMTLWSIGRSPLILGANLPKNDDATLALLTNDEVLAVNQNSANNHQAYHQNNHFVWVADVPNSTDKYVAIFNANPAPPPGRGRGRRGGPGGGTPPAAAPISAPAANTANTTVPPSAATSPTSAPVAPASSPMDTQPATLTIAFSDIGLSGSYKVRDLWAHQDAGTATGNITATVNSHGAVLYRLTPVN